MSSYIRRGRYLVPRDTPRRVHRDVSCTRGRGGTVVMRCGSDFNRAISEQTPEPDSTADLMRALEAQRRTRHQ